MSSRIAVRLAGSLLAIVQFIPCPVLGQEFLASLAGRITGACGAGAARKILIGARLSF